MRKIILGNAFLNALADAGIIHQPERTGRVIVDAKAGEPVVMYVMAYGDERLVEVVANGGIEIVEERAA